MGLRRQQLGDLLAGFTLRPVHCDTNHNFPALPVHVVSWVLSHTVHARHRLQRLHALHDTHFTYVAAL